MTCRIAYICGKQGLPIIPFLRDFTGPDNLMVFASPSAFHEWEGDHDSITPVESADTLKADMKHFNPDIILVMTYLSRLDVSLSESSQYGMVNIHPSLLPKYRGGAPIFYALKNGEEHIGVTFHFVTEAFDQGDIIHQTPIKVTPQDCASSVWLKVMKKIVAALPGVIENRSQWASMAMKQNDGFATSIGFPSPEERSLSNLKCAEENLSIIRACGRATGAPLSINGRTIFVTDASMTRLDGKPDELVMAFVSADNHLVLKVLDGWIQVDAARYDNKAISSWGFIMEVKDDGA
ncbi:formyltransferase family protein [Pseudomonas sp. PB3P13]